jgi:SAM-dependent methyltransferase
VEPARRPDPRDLAETQRFFAERAAAWEKRFPDDGPSYASAVAELAPPPAGTVIDLGAGTGRSVAPLRESVGQAGLVIALDATWEMLAAARGAGRDPDCALVLADGLRLPLRAHACDAVFAAGILHHLPGPTHGLDELARVTRPGGRLAIFHVIGRAALAARHGRPVDPDDPLDPANLAPLLVRSGWRLTDVDDSHVRYLAIAIRV